MDKKRRVVILLGVLGCYFIFGYYDSARGATLSQLMDENAWSYDTGSWLAFLYYMGYFLATLLGGTLSDRLSKKSCLIGGGVILIAATGGYMLSGVLLFSAVLFFGIALGIFEIAGNGTVVELYPPEQRGRYLNFVAGMHSVGAVLAPVLCGLAATYVNWRAAFGAIVPLIAVVAIGLAIGKMPQTLYSIPSDFSPGSFFKALVSRPLRKYYCLAFLYLAAESTVISWIVSFLNQERNVEFSVASTALSVFFLMIGTGRLLGGTLLSKLPVYTVLSFGYPLAASGVVVGALVPSLWWVLPVSGIFFSALLPTSLAAMSNACEKDAGASMGVFFACGAAGGMIGSWAAGQLGAFWGIRFGILLAAIFLFVGAAVVFKAVRR